MSKIAAVICEYNPMHSGHIYQLEKVRRISLCDRILCVMSGNFVQRAEPAIADMYVRAEIALNNGADAVIMLPTVFATAGGELFARGAVRILSAFSDVKYLSFGAECANEKLLTCLAKIQNDENDAFKSTLKDWLGRGETYAAAYTAATIQQAEKQGYSANTCEQVLREPNNLLGIAYIKALLRQKSDIMPLPIQRIGNNHNNFIASGEYLSATAVRALIERGERTALLPYLPEKGFDRLLDECRAHPVDRKIYEALVLHALRTQDVGDLLDAGEGLELKLQKCAARTTSLDEALFAAKTKRYPLSRIRRLGVQALLGITKTLMQGAADARPRLIGIREDFRHELAAFPKSVLIQNKDADTSTPEQQAVQKIDQLAQSIYTLVTNKPGEPYFDNKLIVV